MSLQPSIGHPCHPTLRLSTLQGSRSILEERAVRVKELGNGTEHHERHIRSMTWPWLSWHHSNCSFLHRGCRRLTLPTFSRRCWRAHWALPCRQEEWQWRGGAISQWCRHWLGIPDSLDRFPFKCIWSALDKSPGSLQNRNNNKTINRLEDKKIWWGARGRKGRGTGRRVNQIRVWGWPEPVSYRDEIFRD